MMQSKETIDRVIDEGFCIGCGACAFAQPDAFQMRFKDGFWKAQRIAASPHSVARLCPMSGEGHDENNIAGRIYPGLPVDASIGRYDYCGVGAVAEGDFRAAGGSGGLLTWVLCRLLEEGLIDAVLHVVPSDGRRDVDPMFGYAISESIDEIRRGAKSRYYPIEMSNVLNFVRNSNKRFAVVGIPCFLKAVRLLQEDGLLSKDSTPFLVGLICGHLKSSYFAELIAWQKGVEPERLGSVDFRVKLRDRPASRYGFSVAARGSDAPASYPMADVVGHDWGEGILKNPACEFCDDVIAECADVAIGDAWLPGHVDDPKGTNVCVVRHPVIRDMIAASAANGAVAIEEVGPDIVAQSQSSGLRHRREGLAHRLARMAEEGRWTPRKRVEPAVAPTSARRRIYDLRLRIAIESNPAFEEAKKRRDLGLFLRAMRPLMAAYHRAYRPTLVVRLAGRCRRLLRKLRPATG